jgi:hypothetical protein
MVVQYQSFCCTSMAMMPWWRWGDESFTQAEVET